MKSFLLATSGLIATALMATGAAAQEPTVTLGGTSIVAGGYVADDLEAGVNHFGMRNDNEITIKVDGKTDAGLGYGAQIDLEADLTDDFDTQGTNAARTFTYLEGAWGRTELGSNKSAAATMRVDASSIAAAQGGINGPWGYFANGTLGGQGFISLSKLVEEHGDVTIAGGDETTYNDTKVSYYTPVYSGLQLGLSYTPNQGDRGQTMLRDQSANPTHIVDLGASYSRDLGAEWNLALAATYETAESGSSTIQDINAWNVGGKLAYQSFSVAGSYGDWGDSNRAASGLDSSYWTAGVNYSQGPVALSTTYMESSREVAAAVDNDFSNLVLGADYKLAPGLTPFVEVSFYEFEGAAFNNQGTATIVGTQLAF